MSISVTENNDSMGGTGDMVNTANRTKISGLCKKMKITAFSLLIAAQAAMMIIFSERVSGDVYDALMRCINVIIPSLFAFMAVSDLLVRTGAYVPLSRIFTPIAKLIGLPVPLVSVFLLGNLAGYPVGAGMICSMYDGGEIEKKSAERLLCTCYNGGAAFFCGAVGLAVFSSKRVGMIVYLSIVLGNVLTAAVYNRIFPISMSRSAESEGRGDRDRVTFRPEMLTECVTAAGVSLFRICVTILFFQSVLTVIYECGFERLFPDKNTLQIGAAFLEISNLSELCGKPFYLLPFVAAAGAFGGVCVILQVWGIVGKRFSLFPFVILRIICAIVSYACCLILNRFFGVHTLEAAATEEFIVNFNNFIPSICLIMMIFLTVFKKGLDFSSEVWYNKKAKE